MVCLKLRVYYIFYLFIFSYIRTKLEILLGETKFAIRENGNSFSVLINDFCTFYFLAHLKHNNF